MMIMFAQHYLYNNNQNTYYTNIKNEEFDKIKGKGKNIEFKIKDEIGKTIKQKDNNESIKTRVTNIYFYDNFEELYKVHLDMIKEYEEKINKILTQYSKEEVDEYGILMI